MVTSHTDSGRRYEHTEDFTGDVKVTVYSGEVVMEERALRGVVTLKMHDLIDIVGTYVRQAQISEAERTLAGEAFPHLRRSEPFLQSLHAELARWKGSTPREALGLHDDQIPEG